MKREGEEADQGAICSGEDRGRMWYIQWKVGLGRGYTTVVRGIGVSVHTTTIDLPRTWETRQRLPTLEVATTRLRSS